MRSRQKFHQMPLPTPLLLLTKMINFITVYFKLASKAFYIYFTSIILFPFLRFLLCQYVVCTYIPCACYIKFPLVGTTSNYFRIFGIFNMQCSGYSHSVKVRENLSFFFSSFHEASAGEATIQKSRTRSTNRTIDLAQFIFVGNCFSEPVKIAAAHQSIYSTQFM